MYHQSCIIIHVSSTMYHHSCIICMLHHSCTIIIPVASSCMYHHSCSIIHVPSFMYHHVCIIMYVSSCMYHHHSCSIIHSPDGVPGIKNQIHQHLVQHRLVGFHRRQPPPPFGHHFVVLPQHDRDVGPQSTCIFEPIGYFL